MKPKFFSFILALAASAITLCASATIRYVSPSGNNSNNGTSWETAKATITAAVNASSKGDEVYVAAGTYKEIVSVKDGVQIRGGYNAATGLRDIENFKSILDGEGLGKPLIIKYSPDCTVPTYVEGMIIQNSDYGGEGGGAFIRGNVILDKCIIRNCKGSGGGGVYAQASSADAPAVIRNSTIELCDATSSGGGAYLYQNAVMEGCIVRGNCGKYGAIRSHKATCIVRNCVIYNNTCSVDGWPGSAGILNEAGGEVYNCTVANNQGIQYAGIHSEGKVYNSVFWGNKAENGFVDPVNFIAGSPSSHNIADQGINNEPFISLMLNADNSAADGPNFKKPTTFVGAPKNEMEIEEMQKADFSLSALSPLINVGNNQYAPDYDIKGEPRPIASVVDVGAYECEYEYEDVVTDGLFTFSDNSKTILLRCSTSATGQVNIPNTVKSIGNYAFDNCSNILSLTIPNGVISIGFSAFLGCTGLTSITIPNSVTSIWGDAFKDCTSLKSVTISSNSIVNRVHFATSNIVSIFGAQVTEYIIGEGVTAIGAYAFCNASNMTSVSLPNSITSIENYAFENCSGITSVVWNAKNCNSYNFGNQVGSFTFGNEVEVIPESLCSGMSKLTSIIIPNSVTNIGNTAFEGCSKMVTVTLNSNSIVSKAYSTSSNIVTLFGPQVTNYVIGEKVTAVGNYAFYHSTDLQSLTIPSSIVSIGQGAYDGCSQLTQVSINSNAVLSKEYSTTANFGTLFGPQVKTYALGNAITAIGDFAFYGCSNITSLNIPNGVTKIGNGSFYGCTGLAYITIPSNVTTIGDRAFQFCTGISALNIPNITRIGISAFADCVGVSSVQFGNSLVSLGDSAFSSCYNLPSVEFPSSLTSIGNYAFYQCNRIPSVNISQNVTSLGDGAFKGCSKLTQVSLNSNAVASKEYNQTTNFASIFGPQVSSYTLGNAVTAIGDYAFYGCGNLSAINLPSTITKIGESAFQNCTGLTSITMQEGITSIEPNTFSGCTGLASVTIPNTVTTIKDNAFANCSSLILNALPASVTTLGNGAFSGCSSISSLIIPASLATVGENAFADCAGLARVDIDSLAAWCNISFANSQANPLFYARNLYINNELLTDLVVPNRITELKNWAFYNCSSLKSVNIPNTVNTVASTAFADCSNITDIEWHAKSVDDYASLTNAPFYASRKKVTSFTLGEEVEHIPAYLCCGMSGISSLAFPAYLKSIGGYAFKDLTKIKQINIPNEVETIGVNAFDSCIFVTSIYLGYQVSEIGDNAFKGCSRVNDITSMNTTTPVVYEKTLASISNYAYLYVQAGSKRSYQLDPYWSRFDIQEIASEEATLTRDAVTVEANEDNAIFTWPTDSAAATYSLQITKDDQVFCTLVFNANGQLTGIAFAPGRNGKAHAPAATMSIAGMTFTVTGLNSASKYAYRLAVADEAKEEIVAYRGEFATTGYTGEVNPGGEAENLDGLEEVTASAKFGGQKILRDGQLFILRDGKTYTAQGQEVR